MTDVSHADIDARLQRGEGRFGDIDAKLAEIAELLKPIPEMQRDIASTKEIVEAWGAVKAAGKFARWMGGIATACVAVWILLRAGVKALLP